MSLMRAFYRSALRNPEKAERVFAKIKGLYAEKASSVVISKGNVRYLGQNLVSLTITEGSATDTVAFDAGKSYGISAASAIIQGLTFAAKQVNGFYANDVQIEYIDPAILSPLAVSVVGRKISVTLASDGTDILSTADDVKAAIVADTLGNSLVGITGTGATPLTAQALTDLAGGSSAQSYDLADIQVVKRIRSRKYNIEIKASA